MAAASTQPHIRSEVGEPAHSAAPEDEPIGGDLDHRRASRTERDWPGACEVTETRASLAASTSASAVAEATSRSGT